MARVVVSGMAELCICKATLLLLQPHRLDESHSIFVLSKAKPTTAGAMFDELTLYSGFTGVFRLCGQLSKRLLRSSARRESVWDNGASKHSGSAI